MKIDMNRFIIILVLMQKVTRLDPGVWVEVLGA